MAVLNAALGMLAVQALFVAPRAAWFAIIPGLVLFAIFRIYAMFTSERGQLETLYEATRDLHAAPQVETSLLAAAGHARDMFEAEFAEIVLLLGPNDAYRTMAGPGEHMSAMDPTNLDRWRLVWDQAQEEQAPFIIDHSGSLASSAGERRVPITSAMVAPITIGGELVGVMVVANNTGGGMFAPTDLELLATLAGHVAVAVENGKLEDSLAQLTELKEELHHQALHDGLTGLANRTLFRERIGHAMQLTRRNGGLAAVLFVDLDDFKNVNDSMGHPAGDELLEQVSSRLVKCCRPEDTVARLGGDEFGVLLEGIEEVQAATVVAERVLESLAAPFRIGGRAVTANASIGVAFGEYGDTANQVLSDADAAMYSAKRGGKGTFQLFESSMHAEALSHIQLKADLEAAIPNQELRLLYQPLVDLETGAIRGYEALVRWQHPRRGWMSPTTFIPFAEQTGLIQPIGRWVLWEALRRLRTWQEVIGPDEADFEVAVNLSARQLDDPIIVEEVARAINDLGTDPSFLVLEITETAMMQSAPARLQELRNLGVRLAIDDFGTGYSSLASLHKLPVDVLKIDRLFVEGIDDEDKSSPFISTIVSLGQSLGLDMIVEGIETSEQFERVRNLGCRLGQGFYFAKPLEAKRADELLRRQVAGEAVFDFAELADGIRDRRLRAVN
jgi:diguanylate cyclase (GGDEF)-like protein